MFQGAWELGRVFGDELFCFCLFVCFSTPKVGDYFVFKSHKWVRFSCLFVVFWVCVLCCFSFKMFNFPTIYLGSGWFFLSRRLVKFFAFFYFCLFVFILFCFVLFCFISNGAPLSLFYYTDDGGHYVIDNFEFPCNSVKNLIPIWNFTNTFIQECKIIWEFQIRWGGTSLLRPLWRSWRYLKAYSLMSKRRRFQNFKKIILFIYLFVYLFIYFCIIP